MEARYYETIQKGKVKCRLCPAECVISPGKRGVCHVRKNKDGVLIAENYGIISASHLDPVEKKPLYHFHPGARIFSIGSIGCNMACFFCQNYDISQGTVDHYHGEGLVMPDELTERALQMEDNLGIAFTYNEPTVYYEYMLDTARLSAAAGMKNVVVTNGYICREPLAQLLEVTDAFNVDLKSYSDSFYRKATHARLLPVKNSLKQIRLSGKHLEITYLLIPGWNDDICKFREMMKWVRDELGPQTVFHLSRYFPAYRSKEPKTPVKLMFRFYEVAKKYVFYVYLGNLSASESQNTICHQCGKMVISRSGYFIQKIGLDEKGCCKYCGTKIVEIK